MRRLNREARVVLLLNAFYGVAEALCSVFVGVYFWVNSLDFNTVCYYYLTIYIVTPFVFILAGWYSQARDRVYVFRIGLVLHAVFYGTLLWLREDSVHYAIPLGALLGVTWGFFWAGNNTFNFDVAASDKRDYFFGWLGVVSDSARLVSPLISGMIIHFLPGQQGGYLVIFASALVLYLGAIVLSVWVPQDRTRRPFRIRRALFPGKDQRDWQWIMLASMSLAGSFNIFHFLLGLVMYMQTGSEMTVGGFTAFQALAGALVSYSIGRLILPRTRRRAMFWGVVVLVAAGAIISVHLSFWTLVIFGFLRSVSQPLFGIPHSSIRFDVIDRCAEDPVQRIEYLCAWEVPLALGRVIMMSALMLCFGYLGETGLRAVLFFLCAVRIVTYFLMSQISTVKQER